MTPYEKYRELPEWDIIEHRLEKLITNQDVKLFTNIDYIVGYLIEGLMREDSLSIGRDLKEE